MVEFPWMEHELNHQLQLVQKALNGAINDLSKIQSMRAELRFFTETITEGIEKGYMPNRTNYWFLDQSGNPAMPLELLEPGMVPSTHFRIVSMSELRHHECPHCKHSWPVLQSRVFHEGTASDSGELEIRNLVICCGYVREVKLTELEPVTT